MKSDNKKMKKSEKVFYTLGAFGNDFFFHALSTLLITFITTQLFDTGDADTDAWCVLIMTNVLVALRIVKIFINPFIGSAIDNTNTRWGKFRPWIIVGGCVSAILLCILFTNFGGLSNSHPLLFIVLFSFIYFVMDLFFSFKDIGFWSMLPALSFISKERETIATIARVGSSIGNAGVNFVAMPIVLTFSLTNNNRGQNGDLDGWFMLGITICIVAITTSLLAGIFTHEKDSKIRKNTEKPAKITAALKEMVKNDQLVWVGIPYLCYCVGTMILIDLQLLYFQFIVGDSSIYTTISFVNMGVGLLAVLIFPLLTKIMTRRTLFICGIVMLLCGLVVYFVSDSNIVLAIIGAELFYFPQQIIFLIVLMIITDCVEYGQWKLGRRNESITLSARSIVDQLGSAIAMLVTSICAIMTGISKTASPADITPDGIFLFKIIMFVVPAILLAVCLFIFAKKHKLTEAKHSKILKDLEQSWGK